jgi:hypothetical protein
MLEAKIHRNILYRYQPTLVSFLTGFFSRCLTLKGRLRALPSAGADEFNFLPETAKINPQQLWGFIFGDPNGI